jgi:hypothetical protein
MSARAGHQGSEDGWRLQNVEELNKLHPRSYFIPPAAERADLKPRDLVKLVFFLDEHPEGAPEAERMWVQVAGRDGDNYTGFLDNQPSLIKTLKPGDRINFGAEHVAAIAYDVAALGYDPDLKIMVNRKVVQEDVLPHRAYKDEPTRPGDSGWTVLVGDEPHEELGDSATFVSSTLGYLADKFPALADVFRSAGGEFHWDPISGRYVHEGSIDQA